jgi:hypothetical protein
MRERNLLITDHYLDGSDVFWLTTHAQRPGLREGTLATRARWPGSLQRMVRRCGYFESCRGRAEATADTFNHLPPRLAQPDVTEFFIEISLP